MKFWCKNVVIDKSRLMILSAQHTRSGESNLLGKDGKSLVRNDETPATEVASCFWTSQSLSNHLAPLQLRRARKLSKCKHFFSTERERESCCFCASTEVVASSWGSRVVKLLFEFKEVLLLMIAALISWRRHAVLCFATSTATFQSQRALSLETSMVLTYVGKFCSDYLQIWSTRRLL